MRTPQMDGTIVTAPRPNAAFQGKTVVITGGSAGLGQALGHAFLAAGGHVCLVARDQARLDAAAQSLDALAASAASDGNPRPPSESDAPGRGLRVGAFAADVTCDDAVRTAFAQIRHRFGPIHVLVNAVGSSDRSAILDVDPDRFRMALELNFLSAVRCTRAAANDLLASRGHVVNIGSLASKVVSPYLGAYPPTKFALAAYTQQLRLELGARGLHVLLVCPGPIQRPDGGKRYEAQAKGLPANVNQPGGGAQLRAIDAADLSRRIVRACQRRDPELVVPGKVRWLAAMAQLWPTLSDRIIIRKTAGRSDVES